MSSSCFASRACIWPLLIVMFAWNTVANAHPFHISLAEIEFNPKSGRIEVSLKIQALDIEQAIATSTKHKFNLEKDSRADELLKAYVEEHLFVTHRDNLKRDDGSGLWQILNLKDKSTTHLDSPP